MWIACVLALGCAGESRVASPSRTLERQHLCGGTGDGVDVNIITLEDDAADVGLVIVVSCATCRGVVLVDDVPRAVVVSPRTQLRVPPGRYRIAVELEGHRRWDGQVYAVGRRS